VLGCDDRSELCIALEAASLGFSLLIVIPAEAGIQLFTIGENRA